MVHTLRSNKLLVQVAIWLVILLSSCMLAGDVLTGSPIHKIVFDTALVLYFATKTHKR